jgi:anti-sigma factor RsiW
MGDLEPRMRAGDADRQKVVEKLGRHFAEGRLTVSEFDDRVVSAHAAVYLDELPRLMVDLPAEPRPVPRPSGPPAWTSRAGVAVMVAMIMIWSVVGVVHGIPPVFPLLLLFLFVRHGRWSRRW